MVGHQPTESKGTARSDLICDGLWLSSSFVCEQAGKPTPGVWLLGYDPYKKAYKGICVGSEDPSPSTMDARYDEKTKTWEFTGSGPMGAFKSTATIKDQDNIVETVTCTEGTKVTKVEITHKRAKSAVAAMDAGATVAKAPTKEHEELLKTVGEWDAVMKMSPEPGAPAMELPGTERVVPIRNGRYVWSDFKMQWQGKPFEGHALCGYDTAQKKYVTYWFESTSPTVAESSGICDSHKKAMTMTGTSRDMNGKPVTTREVTTSKDDNTRLMQMESKGEKTESFEITFKRKK